MSYFVNAGATIVQNFTIMGNSLGDAPWSGYIPITDTYDNGTVYNTSAYGYNNGSWYVATTIPAYISYVCAKPCLKCCDVSATACALY